MKNLLILPVLAMMFSSCIWLESDLGFGASRLSENRKHIATEDSEGPGRALADTFLYMSAVKVPEEYDWRRDTACGAALCTLLMLRSRIQGDRVSPPEPIVSIPASRVERVSADVDLHHIIGTHLYTEYSDISGTSVTRDGRVVVEYPGREVLQGLLPLESAIWTLGRSLDGGFALRKDGAVVYRQESGSVFGGFNESGYGPTGALYEDDGQVCFSFMQSSGGRRSVFVVRDGTDKLLLSTTAAIPLDAKSVNGEDVLVSKGAGTVQMQYGGDTRDMTVWGQLDWQSGGILSRDGQPMFAGTFRWSDDGGDTLMGGVFRENGIYCNLEYGSDRICCSRTHFFGVGEDSEGVVHYHGIDNYGRVYVADYLDEPCYLFSSSCSTLSGGDWYVALTPWSGRCRPFVLGRHGSTEIDLNGFLSGISVEICPLEN